MVKNPIILLLFFIILFVVNITFAMKLHRYSKRHGNIALILEELSSLKSLDAFVASDPKAKAFVDEEIRLGKDPRIATLKVFFRKYDSPLYDKAEFIVQTADKYEMDHRLIPAIAVQESGVCRVIPPNSHNCWGWGIYGNTITRFASYEEAIETVSKGLKQNYIGKGLTTPDDIMRKYTPSSNGSWAYGVNTFLKVLEY